MSKRTEVLNQRISEYLTDLYSQKIMIEDLESEKSKLKKDIAHHRAQARKNKEDKAVRMSEIKRLKQQLKEMSAGGI